MQIMKNSRNIVENLAATAPFNIIDIILATGGHLDGKVGTWCDDGTTLIEKKIAIIGSLKDKTQRFRICCFYFSPILWNLTS